MSYMSLFENILNNFLNEDFVKNANDLFNETKDCKCKKNNGDIPQENKQEDAPFIKRNACSFVRSEVTKTTNEGFEFKTFLPGIEKKNIKINIFNDVMCISLVDLPNTNLEFIEGSYCKKIVLGDKFNYNKITAEYKDNILRVFVPYNKIEEKKFEIKIN